MRINLSNLREVGSKAFPRIQNIAAIVAVSLITDAVASPVKAGPVGPASEITQLMNNAELVALVAKETEGVALNSKQLVTQVEQLRTQFLSYQNLLQNTLGLSETQWAEVASSIQQLRGVMTQAGALAGWTSSLFPDTGVLYPCP